MSSEPKAEAPELNRAPTRKSRRTVAVDEPDQGNRYSIDLLPCFDLTSAAAPHPAPVADQEPSMVHIKLLFFVCLTVLALVDEPAPVKTPARKGRQKKEAPAPEDAPKEPEPAPEPAAKPPAKRRLKQPEVADVNAQVQFKLRFGCVVFSNVVLPRPKRRMKKLN